MENGAEIPDIANCEEEMAEAIQFMVSKGYFSLDEAGNFAPDAPLTAMPSLRPWCGCSLLWTGA